MKLRNISIAIIVIVLSIFGQIRTITAQTVVLSLKSTGQTAVSGSWTNPNDHPVKIRVTAQGGGGGRGYTQYTVYDDDDLTPISYPQITIGGSTGATMQGEFTVNSCETIFAIAGAQGGGNVPQMHPGTAYLSSGGGGGGSGVVKATTNTLLLLAAGGTGADIQNNGPGLGGSAATTGNGSGGSGGIYSTGGGGLNGDGASTNNNNCPTIGGGKVNLQGISPGGSHCLLFDNSGNGGSGMGGGGGASNLAGGGGGHTGGNGGTLNSPSYGLYSSASSYNIGSNPVNTNGLNNVLPNDGTVVIELLEDPLPPLVVTVNKSNISCYGLTNGSVNLVAGGGLPSYTYDLVGVGTNTTGNFTGLGKGTYTYIVKDAGCLPFTYTNTFRIDEPSEMNIIPGKVDETCNGSADGIAGISVFDGTAPYTYAWSNGGSNSFINNLTAGNYAYTVTDKNGCSYNNSITVGKLTTITVTPSVTGVKCFGGSDGTASISASGGTTPYTYAWSNGATTASINNLTAGTYFFTVTDLNGCIEKGSVLVGQPTALSVSTSKTDVKCNGGADGTAGVSVNGGTTPYTYAWSNGATTANISNLTAGTYAFTVTDKNGCSQTGSVLLVQPTALSVISSKTDVKCNGGADGTAGVSVSGGTTPYTYAWSNGATTANISNLSAGTYFFTVTDFNKCIKIGNVILGQPTALVLTKTQTNILCNSASSGAIDLAVSGGTAPYTYKWSNNATTQDLTNLKAGTYTVTVKDINGCSGTLTTTLTQNSEIKVKAGSCKYVFYGYGSNCTSLTATASGGGGTYTYKWSPGSLSGATVNVCPIKTTEYEVTVTDQYGCKEDEEVTVNVIDVRCGSKKDKVTICHSGTTLCVDKIGVADHLAHGDKLGTCGTTACGLTLRSEESNITDHQLVTSNILNLQYYPNPVDDRLTVQLEQVTEGVVQFEFYDITGKMVKKENRTMVNGYNDVSINMVELTSGLYLLQVKDSKNQRSTIKLTKL